MGILPLWNLGVDALNERQILHERRNLFDTLLVRETYRWKKVYKRNISFEGARCWLSRLWTCTGSNTFMMGDVFYHWSCVWEINCQSWGHSDWLSSLYGQELLKMKPVQHQCNNHCALWCKRQVERSCFNFWTDARTTVGWSLSSLGTTALRESLQSCLVYRLFGRVQMAFSFCLLLPSSNVPLAAPPRMPSFAIRKNFRSLKWGIQVIADCRVVACVAAWNLADIVGEALFERS